MRAQALRFRAANCTHVQTTALRAWCIAVANARHVRAAALAVRRGAVERLARWALRSLDREAKLEQRDRIECAPSVAERRLDSGAGWCCCKLDPELGASDAFLSRVMWNFCSASGVSHCTGATPCAETT